MPFDVDGEPVRKKNAIVINLSNCRYDIVALCAKKCDFDISFDEKGEEGFNVWWQDTSVSVDRVMALKKHQKINHFPGMINICKKDELAINLNRMRRVYPMEYDFYPMTFCLPREWKQFREASRDSPRTWIVKPQSGCQGKGIYLTNSMSDIDPDAAQVAQEYIPDPFLIDGHKFDLRVYVLVLSVSPLRIFLYDDGLTRLCTEEYVKPNSSNIGNQFMHLTNYSINKNSEKFNDGTRAVESDGNDEDGEESSDTMAMGHKRSIEWFKGWLQAQGHDAKAMWQGVGDAVVKTLISHGPKLSHIYGSCCQAKGAFGCFEILGFDFMLDSKLKPWLIEVNHSPSLFTDSSIDERIKEGLISETIALLNLSHKDKRNARLQAQAQAQQRLYSGVRQPVLQGRFNSLLNPHQQRTQAEAGEREKALQRQERCERLEAQRYRLIYPLEPDDAEEQQRAVYKAMGRARSIAGRQGQGQAQYDRDCADLASGRAFPVEYSTLLSVAQDEFDMLPHAGFDRGSLGGSTYSSMADRYGSSGSATPTHTHTPPPSTGSGSPPPRLSEGGSYSRPSTHSSTHSSTHAGAAYNMGMGVSVGSPTRAATPERKERIASSCNSNCLPGHRTTNKQVSGTDMSRKGSGVSATVIVPPRASGHTRVSNFKTYQQQMQMQTRQQETQSRLKRMQAQAQQQAGDVRDVYAQTGSKKPGQSRSGNRGGAQAGISSTFSRVSPTGRGYSNTRKYSGNSIVKAVTGNSKHPSPTLTAATNAAMEYYQQQKNRSRQKRRQQHGRLPFEFGDAVGRVGVVSSPIRTTSNNAAARRRRLPRNFLNKTMKV